MARGGAVAGLGLLVLLALSSFPAAHADADARPFARGIDRAERLTPPEPVSAWILADREIEHLVARGELPLEAWTFRPVDRGEMAAWLVATESEDASPSRTRLNDLFRWEREVWLGETGDAERTALRPGAAQLYRHSDRLLMAGLYARWMPVVEDGDTYHWTPNSRVGFRGMYYGGTTLAIVAGLFAAEIEDARSFADPLVAGTDLILHEEEATVSARVAGLRLRAGRDRHHWGPGVSGTLLLSSSGEPFNFLEYQIRLADRLRFVALTGATNLHQRRYVAAHRLSWSPRANLNIGLAEGARYEAGGPHLLYMLGFLPYTLIERLDFQDSSGDSTRQAQRNNVMWAVDATWAVRPGWLLYGEILADDIATESSAMPTRGGYQLGTTLAPIWHGWDWTLGAEYTRVSNYTYSVYYQDLCRCNWEHQGYPLGYKDGPDVENVLLRCNVDPHPAWGGRLWGRRVRKGEGRIGRPWKPEESGCEPGDDPDCGPVDAWTLSGLVEKTTALGIELLYRPHPWLRTSAWLELQRIENRDHEPSDAKTGTLLGLSLSLGIS